MVQLAPLFQYRALRLYLEYKRDARKKKEKVDEDAGRDLDGYQSRRGRNVYFSCTRGSIIQDVNRGKNATTVRPGGRPRITRPRDESLRSLSFYQPRFSQTEIRFESSLHRLMYAATGLPSARYRCIIHAAPKSKYFDETSSSSPPGPRARPPRAYFSRTDNYPEELLLLLLLLLLLVEGVVGFRGCNTAGLGWSSSSSSAF